MKNQLRLSQRQRLGLTLSMRTSLRILRMTADELVEEIAREVADNPFIELEQVHASSAAYDAALEQVSSEISLIQSIAQQITTQPLDPETEAAALLLAAELRSDGYLDVTLEELSGELGVPLAILENGLRALQRCDPPGIGARTLAECLEIQLVDAGISPERAAIAVQHLDEFSDMQWTRLLRLADWTRAELVRIGKLLRSFSPVPVKADSLPQETRIPDLLVDKSDDGRIALHLNPDALPRMSVLQLDRGLAVSDALGRLYRRAVDLQSALRSRALTLRRIAAHLATVQEAHIRDALQPIQPLSRKQAAAQLGMHPSTLGRAIRGKSLLVDGKTIALSQFFQSALPTRQGDISAFDLQRRIRSLIHSEDPAAPLADDMICTHLKNEGVDIARRTVAKYRKCMRIPSSFERRRQKGRRDASAARGMLGENSGH